VTRASGAFEVADNKIFLRRGDTRRREINEVLDTCLSPVARVCCCRSAARCNDAPGYFYLKAATRFLFLPRTPLRPRSRMLFLAIFRSSVRHRAESSIRQCASSSDHPLAKFPSSGIYSSSWQDERPLSLDCSEIRFSIASNWNPGVSKSTDGGLRTFILNSCYRSTRQRTVSICLSLVVTRGDIRDRLYILAFKRRLHQWDQFAFITLAVNASQYRMSCVMYLLRLLNK